MVVGAGLCREKGTSGLASRDVSEPQELVVRKYSPRQSRGQAPSLDWIRPEGPEGCSYQLWHQGNRCLVPVASVPVLGKGYFTSLVLSWGIPGGLRIDL